MPLQVRKGLDKVNEVAQRQTFSGQKNRFINWKADETKTIRFLTEGDEIVLTALHEFVPTFDQKRNSFVCRRELEGVTECELCDSIDKPRELALAVAVEREPTQQDGKTVLKTRT